MNGTSVTGSKSYAVREYSEDDRNQKGTKGLTKLTKSYDVENQMRQLVFQRTRAYLAAGRRMHALAVKAGVADTTLRKLAYGETKYPRFHTVIAVCDALGVTLTIAEKPMMEVVPTVGKGARK